MDLRPAPLYRTWHWRGAVHEEYEDLALEYGRLDRERTYVLYCEFGLKSARLAEVMQRAGYEAYSFLGGAKALRRRSRDRDPALEVSSETASSGTG
jgi:thiamine biosynthesis protein ThiI